MDVATLDRATAHLTAVVSMVRPSHLALPTPCEGWAVRDLLQHMISGNLTALRQLRDAGVHLVPDIAARAAVPQPRRELTLLESTALAQCEAFTAAGAADVVVTDLLGPDEPVALIDLRIGESVVHAWDLAQAIGHDAGLPDDLIRAGLDLYEPIADRLRAAGRYGDGPVAAPEATTLEQWLLHLTGRRP